MRLEFQKFQATGNDFIMIDNLSGKYDKLSFDHVVKLCDRKFGIGADGLILIEKNPETDFYMNYFNADGSQSFCGNGARSAVRFYLNSTNSDKKSLRFSAIDGPHHARIVANEVALEMFHYGTEKLEDDYIIQTGSPHYIHFIKEIQSSDIVEYGRKIRYSERFNQEGINVNLIQKTGEKEFSILTYERGVEDETLSCGTGVTAAALAFALEDNLNGDLEIHALTKGGKLRVRFESEDFNFRKIELIGPALLVYKGQIDV